jgi:hypothetical protein
VAIVQLAESALESILGGQQHKTVVASSKVSAKAPDDGASQTVATQPGLLYILFALLALAAGFAGGLAMQDHFHPGMTKLPVLPSGIGIFGVLYVLAQAIERILQPVSWFGGGFLGGLKGGSTKTALAKEHQSAVVLALKDPHNPDDAQCAADSLHEVNQYKANLTATSFGVAALLAMLVSGYTGLFLLSAVGLHIAGWLDLLVTGLAIAGGTKPLHDAISSLSASTKGKTSGLPI